MISEGKYRAKALGGFFDKTKAKGTDYVQVDFEIVGGPNDGKSVEWRGYFTEKTAARTIDSLRFCGCTFPDDDLTNLEGIESNEVEIVVGHETFDGRDGKPRTVAKVQWVNHPNGFVRRESTMPEAEKIAFRDRMKGLLITTKPTAPATAPARANGHDDDIPF